MSLEMRGCCRANSHEAMVSVSKPQCGFKIIPFGKEQTKHYKYNLRLVLEHINLLQEQWLPLECVLEIDVDRKEALDCFLAH